MIRYKRCLAIGLMAVSVTVACSEPAEDADTATETYDSYAVQQTIDAMATAEAKNDPNAALERRVYSSHSSYDEPLSQLVALARRYCSDTLNPRYGRDGEQLRPIDVHREFIQDFFHERDWSIGKGDEFLEWSAELYCPELNDLNTKGFTEYPN